MGGVMAKQSRNKQGDLPLACSTLIEEDANPWVLEGLSGKLVYRRFQPDLTRLPVDFKIACVTKGFSIAVTRSRLVTATWGRPQLHLSLADSRLWRRHIRLVVLPSNNATATSTANNSTPILSLTADAQLFDPLYRGQIEVRWHTHEASELYRRIVAGLAYHNQQQARHRRNRRLLDDRGLGVADATDHLSSLVDSSFSGGTACTYEDTDYDEDGDDDPFVDLYEIREEPSSDSSLPTTVVTQRPLLRH